MLSLCQPCAVPSMGTMLHPFDPLVYTPDAVRRYGEPTRLSSERSAGDDNPISVRVLYAAETPGSYRRGEHRCRTLIDRNIMEERERGFVLYTIERAGRPDLTGLVGSLDLEGAVLYPHEGVMPSAVAARRADIERAGAFLEPVIVASDLSDVTWPSPRALLRKVSYDDESHVVSSLSPDVVDVGNVIGRDGFIILDGHHRIAATRQHAEHAGTTALVLAMVVDHRSPGLFVGPQHRVLAGQVAPFDNLRGIAEVAPYRRGEPVVPGSVAIVGRDVSVVFTIGADGRAESEQRISALTLERELLGRLDMRVEGYATREVDAYAELDAGAGAVAIMGDLAIADIVDTARRGVVLPEKTTCFNPKVAVGLVGALLDPS